MPMNKQSVKSDMYDWIGWTWNPVRGVCPHKCVYCYVRPNSGILRLVPKELKEDLGQGNFIFLGSSTDMFADLIPSDWILQVLKYSSLFDNQYLCQTKNAARLLEFMSLFPKRTTLGTTIETNRYQTRPVQSGTFDLFPSKEDGFISISSAPSLPQRTSAMEAVSKAAPKYGLRTMVTIEPIMKFDLDIMVKWMETIGPDFINIGADSKRHNLPEPSWAKVQKLIDELSEFTEVRTKPNLNRLRNARG